MIRHWLGNLLVKLSQNKLCYKFDTKGRLRIYYTYRRVIPNSYHFDIEGRLVPHRECFTNLKHIVTI